MSWMFQKSSWCWHATITDVACNIVGHPGASSAIVKKAKCEPCPGAMELYSVTRWSQLLNDGGFSFLLSFSRSSSSSFFFLLPLSFSKLERTQWGIHWLCRGQRGWSLCLLVHGNKPTKRRGSRPVVMPHWWGPHQSDVTLATYFFKTCIPRLSLRREIMFLQSSNKHNADRQKTKTKKEPRM